eukprot:3063578-Rhodomonas_salina.1
MSNGDISSEGTRIRQLSQPLLPACAALDSLRHIPCSSNHSSISDSQIYQRREGGLERWRKDGRKEGGGDEGKEKKDESSSLQRPLPHGRFSWLFAEREQRQLCEFEGYCDGGSRGGAGEGQ